MLKTPALTLKKAIDAAEDSLQRRKAAQELEERRQRTEEEAAWRKERASLSRKTALSEEIFAWAARFAKGPEFKRLIHFADSNSVSSINGGVSGAVWIYTGAWGHTFSGDDDGCHSRLYLSEAGELFYSAGYKWMTSGPHFTIHSPTEMAEKLTPLYIRTLRNHMRSGSAYKELAANVQKWIRRWGTINEEST